MQKTVPLDSLIETKSGKVRHAPARVVTPSKPSHGISARLLGLLLASTFSAGAWYLIYRLVISLTHGG